MRPQPLRRGIPLHFLLNRLRQLGNPRVQLIQQLQLFCGSRDLHLQATWETRLGGSLSFHSSAEADTGWLAHHGLGMVKALDDGRPKPRSASKRRD